MSFVTNFPCPLSHLRKELRHLSILRMCLCHLSLLTWESHTIYYLMHHIIHHGSKNSYQTVHVALYQHCILYYLGTCVREDRFYDIVCYACCEGFSERYIIRNGLLCTIACCRAVWYSENRRNICYSLPQGLKNYNSIHCLFIVN